jgi:hypothetical protein
MKVVEQRPGLQVLIVAPLCSVVPVLPSYELYLTLRIGWCSSES